MVSGSCSGELRGCTCIGNHTRAPVSRVFGKLMAARTDGAGCNGGRLFEAGDWAGGVHRDAPRAPGVPKQERGTKGRTARPPRESWIDSILYVLRAKTTERHAADTETLPPADRILRHGVVMPRTSCPRLTRESPHQLAVPHVSWRQPRTRNTALGGRPTAARIHITARVNMCIQISPIESPLVGHVTAGRAALETGCMPTPLQRDAGTIPS